MLCECFTEMFLQNIPIGIISAKQNINLRKQQLP